MQKLIAAIESAFAEGEFPGEDQLTDSTYGDEPAALIDEFRDQRDWRALTTEFLNNAPDGFGSALSFFSAGALRFYLPAYLIADLEDRLISGNDPAFRLCNNVTPGGEKVKLAKLWGGGTMGERDRACFDAFSAQQVAAIVAYLWWKLEQSGGHDEVIEQAMMHYWLPRLDQK